MSKGRIDKSVALKYDFEGAPRVVAAGQFDMAEQIISRAIDADVPIVEDPQLAHVLSKVPLGEEIPQDLYRAVAEVLVFLLRVELDLDQRA